jgi:hypothetical protein
MKGTPKHRIRRAHKVNPPVVCLEALQRERLERELAAGYIANASVDRRISDEFLAVDFGKA